MGVRLVVQLLATSHWRARKPGRFGIQHPILRVKKGFFAQLGFGGFLSTTSALSQAQAACVMRKEGNWNRRLTGTEDGEGDKRSSL